MIMARRTIWLILLACCPWLVAIPVSAKAESRRIQVIMSGLPPQDSATYKAMRELAGQATSKFLMLTKTEVWSIPRGNIIAVSTGARRHGIEVRQIGADWNHVLQPAPADTKFSDKQKALLEGAATSKATLGVAIMVTPASPMVEYALTKDNNFPAASANAPKIRVGLNKSTILTITRSSVEIESNMCTWRGRVDGTGAPVMLIWWPSGKFAGAIRHNGRIYSIRHMGGELHAVIEMRKDWMPPLHAPIPERTPINHPDRRAAPSKRTLKARIENEQSHHAATKRSGQAVAVR